jgi:hypothetical protein
MYRIRRPPYLTKAIVSVALILFVLCCFMLTFPKSAAAIGKFKNTTSLTSEIFTLSTVQLAQVSKQAAEPPRRKGRGGNWWARLIGLGRRGSCSSLRLVALSPICSEEGDCSAEFLEDGASGSAKLGITLTGSSEPTFWFYVYLSEETLPDLDSLVQASDLELVQYAEFMLQDEHGQDAIEKPLLLTFEEPLLSKSDYGKLMSFQWPAELPLKTNRPYNWYLSILCNPERPSRNLSVGDWIEIIDFEEEQVEDLTFERKLEIYSERDLWNETITTLITESCERGIEDELTEELNVLISETLADSNMADDFKGELVRYCDKPQRLIPLHS